MVLPVPPICLRPMHGAHGVPPAITPLGNQRWQQQAKVLRKACRAVSIASSPSTTWHTPAEYLPATRACPVGKHVDRHPGGGLRKSGRNEGERPIGTNPRSYRTQRLVPIGLSKPPPAGVNKAYRGGDTEGTATTYSGTPVNGSGRTLEMLKRHGGGNAACHEDATLCSRRRAGRKTEVDREHTHNVIAPHPPVRMGRNDASP